MKQKHFIQVWMLVVLLFPQMAEAASYMKNAASYKAMLSGKNTIDLSLPTFDYYTIGANVYQSERSRIKVVLNKDTVEIFAWKSLGNNWNNKSAAMCWKGENFTILCEQYGIGLLLQQRPKPKCRYRQPERWRGDIQQWTCQHIQS